MALWDDGKYKNPKKAADYWDRAIRSKQNTVEAYNNRGLAYHELKQYDKAIADFSQAIRLDALHLAAAQELSVERLVTADKRMRDAADRIEMAVDFFGT